MTEKSVKNGKRMFSGVAVGLANGLFGGGGGMIAVPALQGTGLREKKAHATAILLILPISAVSFLLYWLAGTYDTSVLIPTAIGVTAGGILGAVLLKKLSTKIVNILFAFLQLAAGIFLFFR